MGVGISTNDWITVIVLLVALWIGYGYRIKVEERALIEQFGDQYQQYQKETWIIIPFIY